MFKLVDLLFNKFNKFQHRIANFDDILFSNKS